MRERWASAGNVAIPSTEKTAEGWIEEIPPSELANFIENRQDEAIAYLMQQGIAEWLNNLEYQPSSRIQYAGVVYKALSVNINQQPNVTPLIWQPAFDSFGSAQAVQDNFDDFIAQDDPFPQYVKENDAILTGDTQAERLELDVLNVRKATPSVGNPKGVVFGSTQTTGFYQAADDKVVYQQAGVTTGFMPSLATIPTATNDKTIVTAEWVRSFISDAIYPIGGLYTTTVNADPSTLLGFGTWQRFAEGRTIVGFSSDVTSATPDWVKSVNNTFGSFDHTLTIPQTPTHKHSTGIYNKFTALSKDVFDAGEASDADGTGRIELTTGSVDNVSSNVEMQIADISVLNIAKMTESSVGGNQPHNNVQPSIVVFIWRRTA